MSGPAPWEELSQEGGTSRRKEVGQAQYPQLHLALEPMDRWTGRPHMEGGQALCVFQVTRIGQGYRVHTVSPSH